MGWGAEELDSLRGTSIHALNDRAAERKRWDAAVLPLLLAHPRCWPGAEADADAAFERFMHASALVGSRSFTDRVGVPAMLPAIDQINHHVVPGRRQVSLEFRGGAYEMVATAAIAAGEEVFQTYGELSSAQLLHSFGFVLRGVANPAAAVEISAAALLRQAAEEELPRVRMGARRWNGVAGGVGWC